MRYGGTPEIYSRVTLIFKYLISLQCNFKSLTIMRDTLWDLRLSHILFDDYAFLRYDSMLTGNLQVFQDLFQQPEQKQEDPSKRSK